MDATYLNEYYAAYDEGGRLERSRRGLVEFATTMRYITRFLRPGCRILEIGAGTGRYSLHLASLGYDVTAVELVEHNLNRLRSGIRPGMNIRAMQGNALDLSALPRNAFDITLLLGPMYHLYTPEDKRRAICQALGATKPGGVVFAAYCISDSSILKKAFGQGQWRQLIADGLMDEDFVTHSGPQDLFELVRKADIDALMADIPAKRLHYVAADGVSDLLRDMLEGMSEETFAQYLRYHFLTCENPDMTGLTDHSLDIFQKPE